MPKPTPTPTPAVPSTEELAIRNARTWLKVEPQAPKAAPEEPAAAPPAAATAAQTRKGKGRREDAPAAPPAATPPTTGTPAAGAAPANTPIGTPPTETEPDTAPKPVSVSSDDTSLPEDPAELQALIEEAQQIDERVLRVYTVLKAIRDNADEELKFLRMAPASFVEAGTGVIVSKISQHLTEDPEFLTRLTRVLVEGNGESA